MRFAYLSSRVTLPGSPERRVDAFEHDEMMAALRGGLAEAGLHGARFHDVSWDDPDADWASCNAVMIGTTWDYWDRQAEFLAALQRISGMTRLFNSPALVQWNSHKGYLQDLEAKGAAVIPTLWLDRAGPKAVAAAFDRLGTDDLVLKRQVGAGADGQVRLRRGEPVPDMAHPMMAQPFLPEILSEGELSFIFVDGAFSHALVKRAAAGDYRIQSTYGGTETALDPSPDDLASARAVLAMLGEVPLYARVDMLRGAAGLLLMELELIEPYLYPLQGPGLGARIARALAARCKG